MESLQPVRQGVGRGRVGMGRKRRLLRTAWVPPRGSPHRLSGTSQPSRAVGKTTASNSGVLALGRS